MAQPAGDLVGPPLDVTANATLKETRAIAATNWLGIPAVLFYHLKCRYILTRDDEVPAAIHHFNLNIRSRQSGVSAPRGHPEGCSSNHAHQG